MKRVEMIMFITTHPNVKITHTLFDDDEYIYFAEDGCVYDERGSLFEDWRNARWARDGIRKRTGSQWEDGWEIKSEQDNGKVPDEGGCHEESQAIRVSMKAYNALRDMFVDFVCSGIHNPAPYCENVSDKCVNCYGWCKQDSDECRGFSPRIERKGNI